MDDFKTDFGDENLESIICKKVSDFKKVKQLEYISTNVEYKMKFKAGGFAKTYILTDKNYTPKGVLKVPKGLLKASKSIHHPLRSEANITNIIGTLGAQKRELRRAKKRYNFEARLSAPHVYQINDRFEMEFIEKGDLSTAPKTLDVYDMLKQTLKLVYDMHSDGYIHRDIKPQNLLLGKDDKIRLADLASVLQIENFNPNNFYLTPQFADFGAHTSREGNKFNIDIYSIAVTTINYLLGDEAFYSRIFDITCCCKSHLKQSRERKVKYINMAKEFDDKELGDILCKMLEGQYDSIKEILYDLDKIKSVVDKKDFKIALSFFSDEKLQDIFNQLEQANTKLNFINDNSLLYNLFDFHTLQKQLDSKDNTHLADLLIDCSEKLEEKQRSHVLKLAEKFRNNTFTESYFKISKQSIKKQQEKNQYSF